MMYEFMTLADDTAIVHSEMRDDGTVKVCCEKPMIGDFKTAYCDIPGYQWYNVENYTPEELEHLKEILKSVAHLIIEYSRTGGVLNAASF